MNVCDSRWLSERAGDWLTRDPTILERNEHADPPPLRRGDIRTRDAYGWISLGCGVRVEYRDVRITWVGDQRRNAAELWRDTKESKPSLLFAGTEPRFGFLSRHMAASCCDDQSRYPPSDPFFHRRKVKGVDEIGRGWLGSQSQLGEKDIAQESPGRYPLDRIVGKGADLPCLTELTFEVCYSPQVVVRPYSRQAILDTFPRLHDGSSGPHATSMRRIVQEVVH